MEYIMPANAQNIPLIINAKGMDALMQNIRIIILTAVYSVPLDRGFAHLGEAVDTPSPHKTALYLANLVDAIEEKEPRVKVTDIRLKSIGEISNTMDGKLTPVVTFRLKDGIKL